MHPRCVILSAPGGWAVCLGFIRFARSAMRASFRTSSRMWATTRRYPQRDDVTPLSFNPHGTICYILHFHPLVHHSTTYHTTYSPGVALHLCPPSSGWAAAASMALLRCRSHSSRSASHVTFVLVLLPSLLLHWTIFFCPMPLAVIRSTCLFCDSNCCI